MDGKQLFDIYTAEASAYGQILLTAYALFGDDIFKALEKAEKENKKIALVEDLSVLGEPVDFVLI